MPVKKLKIGFIKKDNIHEFIPEDINTAIIQIDTYEIIRQYITNIEKDTIEEESDNLIIDIYNQINEIIGHLKNIETLIIMAPNIVWHYMNKLYGINISKLVEDVFRYYVDKMKLNNFIVSNLDNHNNIFVDDDVYLSSMGYLFVGTIHDIGIKSEYLWCFSNYISIGATKKALVNICYYNDVIINSFFRCLPYDSLNELYLLGCGYAGFKQLFTYLKFHLAQVYDGLRPDFTTQEVKDNIFYDIIIDKSIIKL